MTEHEGISGKQIRLREKIIEIESCGGCPLSKQYSLDMDYCSALSDHFDGSVPYPPCPGDYRIRDDCPLEDAPDQVMLPQKSNY